MPFLGEQMERIRGDLLRRARRDEHEEPIQPEGAQGRSNQHPRFQRYARRLASSMPSRSHPRDAHHHNSEESPKSPTTGSGWPVVAPSSTNAPSLQLQPTLRDHTFNIPTVTVILPQQPEASLVRHGQSAITHANDGRGSAATGEAAQSSAARPKRLLGCLPWSKSRKIRSLTIQSVISGIFLFAVLAVYLGLTISRTIAISELTVLLLIVVIFATVYFCYTFIRLCILVARGDKSYSWDGRMNTTRIYPGGYAMPQQPIRVVLARDEEDQISEPQEENYKAMPPAYGLWRESIRLDPNRLFWQRNETAEMRPVPEVEETRSGPRPPSYASEDGVSYVVDARPRSMAPQAMVQQSSS